MITMLQLGPINFDLSSLISFLIGIGFGLMLFLLLYLYAVIKSLNKGLKLRSVEEEDIDEEEIKWLINDAHNQFKDKKLRKEVGFGKLLLDLSTSLSFDIASKFYPQSKYPYLELSIDEILVLLRYISTRFDQLLSKKILKLFRGITLSKLMTLKDVKEVADKNLIVKSGLKAKKVYSKVMSVVNVVNPVYWFRKIVISNMTNVVMVKLGLAIISITGEETYKIYSKSVFNADKQIETDIDQIYQEIKQTMKEEAADEEE